MVDRKASVIVLAEDVQMRSFIRRFLKGLNFDTTNKYRDADFPPGQGSGEQRVRELLLRELVAYRGRVAKGYKGFHLLIVLTDADQLTVRERRRQLEEEIKTAGVGPLRPDEDVAILIPRRNIETWIYFLNSKAVDETSSYRKLMKPSDCKEAVSRLVELYRSDRPLPDDLPDSLRVGIEELRRVVG